MENGLLGECHDLKGQSASKEKNPKNLISLLRIKYHVRFIQNDIHSGKINSISFEKSHFV